MPIWSKYSLLIIGLMYASIELNTVLADSSILLSSQEMQKQTQADEYQSHLRIIKQYRGMNATKSLVSFTKTIQSDTSLHVYQKESLLEESITALASLPSSLASQQLMEALSSYSALSKTKLSDGPHFMQVNATSVAALAKLALQNWETEALTKTLKQHIENGDIDLVLNKNSKDKNYDRVWLNAAKAAITTSSDTLPSILQSLQTRKSHIDSLRLLFLVAKRINQQTAIQSSLSDLAATKDTQAFALQELRQLNIAEYFSIYESALSSPYLSSFALSSLGQLAATNSKAFTLISSRLNDEKLGGQAAFALRYVQINQLQDYITQALTGTDEVLYTKRLLLSLKLHPEGADALAKILSSNQLSTALKHEVSAWLN